MEDMNESKTEERDTERGGAKADKESSGEK